MITLPATIPGLVRPGTPLLRDGGAGWIATRSPIATRPMHTDEAKYVGHHITALFVSPVQVHDYVFMGDAKRFTVNLTDPTGQFHALLWLAEKFGVDATGGLTWGRFRCGEHGDGDGNNHPCTRYVWSLMGLNPDQLVQFHSCGEDAETDSSRFVRGIDSLIAPAEALRLAVLAVAGAVPQ